MKKGRLNMTACEKELRRLFDYQRFEGEDHLSSLIEKTMTRWESGGVPLADESLELHAAGVPDPFTEEGDRHV